MNVLPPSRTADAGTALNEAIAALPPSGGTVLIPAGTWTIDTPVLFDRNGIIIQGASRSATTLRFNGVSVSPAIKMADTLRRHGVIRDLMLQSSVSGAGTAIDASYFVNGIFDNLQIGGPGRNPNRGIVFHAEGTYYNLVQNCGITAMGEGARCISFDSASNSNVVRNCRLIGDNTNTIMVYVNSHAVELDRVDIERDGSIGIDVASGGHDCTVIAPYIEAVETGIRLASGVRAFTCLGGIIIDNAINVQDDGAMDPAFINTRVQYRPYTSYTARSTAFPQSYPIQTAGDQPQDHALISWAYDPALVSAGTVVGKRKIYLSKVYVRNRATMANVHWWVTEAGSGATTGQNEIGLYDSFGHRIRSANVDQSITSAGLKTTSLSAALPPGWYWVAMVFNALNAPALGHACHSTGAAEASNVGLSTSALRFATNSTGQASLPVVIQPAGNAPTPFAGPWAAIG
ncbi:right-handed parallel beta-helix repeat-containing protein [Streptomyces sp. NPDC000410]|uniref:right-handed parallel beta-helix repeat-containing protein n=1 Tax=Streptomyces sp. NPDC000410 TaxID=3154254 RepID=UPI003321366A